MAMSRGIKARQKERQEVDPFSPEIAFWKNASTELFPLRPTGENQPAIGAFR